MLIFRIITIAVLVTITSLIIKQYKPDLAVLITIAGGLLVLLLLLDSFTHIFDWFSNISEKTGVSNDVIKPVIKILGIGYIAEFSSSICEDFGSKSMASKVVLAGKLVIMVIAIPILSLLLETIVGVL